MRGGSGINHGKLRELSSSSALPHSRSQRSFFIFEAPDSICCSSGRSTNSFQFAFVYSPTDIKQKYELLGTREMDFIVLVTGKAVWVVPVIAEPNGAAGHDEH